jgi:hypothetical protein
LNLIFHYIFWQFFPTISEWCVWGIGLLSIQLKCHSYFYFPKT